MEEYKEFEELGQAYENGDLPPCPPLPAADDMDWVEVDLDWDED